MISSKTEVKTLLLNLLAGGLDELLEANGFSRKSNSLKYSRAVSDAIQEIDFPFDFKPRSNPEAVADLLPNLTLFNSEVSRVALEMVGGNALQLADAPEIVLRQQFHVAAPGGKPQYWYLYGDERDIESVKSMSAFIQHWVLPLLNELTNTQSITSVYESNDERILKQRHFFIYVAAAYVLLGTPAKAMKVLEEKFGRPGTRRTHGQLFEYVEPMVK